MSDIEQILYPTVLTSLREDTPPVKCIVWKGKDEYETIEFSEFWGGNNYDTVTFVGDGFETQKRVYFAIGNENDFVFDPCFGSGSFINAAINTNRNYIGFETSTEYFNTFFYDNINK